jgi:phosphoenolpyruvate phosphomutase
VIWANHLMRASIAAMQGTASMIHAARSIMTVEKEIASVKEIFRLQNVAELTAAEERYLPQHPPELLPVTVGTPAGAGQGAELLRLPPVSAKKGNGHSQGPGSNVRDER